MLSDIGDPPPVGCHFLSWRLTSRQGVAQGARQGPILLALRVCPVPTPVGDPDRKSRNPNREAEHRPPRPRRYDRPPPVVDVDPAHSREKRQERTEQITSTTHH